MKRALSKSFWMTIVGITIVLSMSSCLTYKDIINFQDGKDLTDGKIDSIQNDRLVRLQPDDVVQVNVFSYNQEAADRFNTLDARAQAQTMRAGGGTGSSITEPLGYRVDSKGFIDFPVIGSVFVQNLTIEELKTLVIKKVEETGYLKDLSVQVRYLSFRFTVLGEVGSPGTFIVPSTKITIFEAIGLARDVSLYSNRDNILVIREQNGARSYGRLNFKSKEIFNSPYYYLQPNDIVYVEPHRTRVFTATDGATRITRTIVSALSVITVLIAIFR